MMGSFVADFWRRNLQSLMTKGAASSPITAPSQFSIWCGFVLCAPPPRSSHVCDVELLWLRRDDAAQYGPNIADYSNEERMEYKLRFFQARHLCKQPAPLHCAHGPFPSRTIFAERCLSYSRCICACHLSSIYHTKQLGGWSSNVVMIEELLKIVRLPGPQAVQIRAEAFLAAGKQVVVTGDLNICPHPLDHCDPDAKHFYSARPDRRWLMDVLAAGDGLFVDGFRLHHPHR